MSDVNEGFMRIMKNLTQKAFEYYCKAENYRKKGELEGALINYLLSTNNLYMVQEGLKSKSFDFKKINIIIDNPKCNIDEISTNLDKALKRNISWIVPLQEKLRKIKKNRGNTTIKDEDKDVSCKNIKVDVVKDCLTFNDIAGQEEAKNQIKKGILYPILNPRLFPITSKGILFYGPPGTGKTLLAKAFVNELQIEANKKGKDIRILFYAPTGASLKGKYVGETEKNIAKYFNCASKQAYSCENAIKKADGYYYMQKDGVTWKDENEKDQPVMEAVRHNNEKVDSAKTIAVLFIDEIDAIAGKRGGDDPMMTNSVNTLLQMMDGVKSFENVVVMGATNYPWNLDDAILRRFDSKIFVTLPKKEDIIELIKIEIASYISKAVKLKSKRKSITTNKVDGCNQNNCNSYKFAPRNTSKHLEKLRKDLAEEVKKQVDKNQAKISHLKTQIDKFEKYEKGAEYHTENNDNVKKYGWPHNTDMPLIDKSVEKITKEGYIYNQEFSGKINPAVCCGSENIDEQVCLKFNCIDKVSRGKPRDVFDYFRKNYFPNFTDADLDFIATKYSDPKKPFSGGDVSNACKAVYKKIGDYALKMSRWKATFIEDPKSIENDSTKEKMEENDNFIKDDFGEKYQYLLFSEYGMGSGYRNLKDETYLFLPKNTYLDELNTSRDKTPIDQFDQYLNSTNENDVVRAGDGEKEEQEEVDEREKGEEDEEEGEEDEEEGEEGSREGNSKQKAGGTPTSKSTTKNVKKAEKKLDSAKAAARDKISSVESSNEPIRIAETTDNEKEIESILSETITKVEEIERSDEDDGQDKQVEVEQSKKLTNDNVYKILDSEKFNKNLPKNIFKNTENFNTFLFKTSDGTPYQPKILDDPKNDLYVLWDEYRSSINWKNYSIMNSENTHHNDEELAKSLLEDDDFIEFEKNRISLNKIMLSKQDYTFIKNQYIQLSFKKGEIDVNYTYQVLKITDSEIFLDRIVTTPNGDESITMKKFAYIVNAKNVNDKAASSTSYREKLCEAEITLTKSTIGPDNTTINKGEVFFNQDGIAGYYLDDNDRELADNTLIKIYHEHRSRLYKKNDTFTINNTQFSIQNIVYNGNKSNLETYEQNRDRVNNIKSRTILQMGQNFDSLLGNLATIFNILGDKGNVYIDPKTIKKLMEQKPDFFNKEQYLNNSDKYPIRIIIKLHVNLPSMIEQYNVDPIIYLRFSIEARLHGAGEWRFKSWGMYLGKAAWRSVVGLFGGIGSWTRAAAKGITQGINVHSDEAKISRSEYIKLSDIVEDLNDDSKKNVYDKLKEDNLKLQQLFRWSDRLIVRDSRGFVQTKNIPFYTLSNMRFKTTYYSQWLSPWKSTVNQRMNELKDCLSANQLADTSIENIRDCGMGLDITKKILKICNKKNSAELNDELSIGLKIDNKISQLDKIKNIETASGITKKRVIIKKLNALADKGFDRRKITDNKNLSIEVIDKEIDNLIKEYREDKHKWNDVKNIENKDDDQKTKYQQLTTKYIENYDLDIDRCNLYSEQSSAFRGPDYKNEIYEKPDKFWNLIDIIRKVDRYKTGYYVQINKDIEIESLGMEGIRARDFLQNLDKDNTWYPMMIPIYDSDIFNTSQKGGAVSVNENDSCLKQNKLCNVETLFENDGDSRLISFAFNAGYFMNVIDPINDDSIKNTSSEEVMNILGKYKRGEALTEDEQKLKTESKDN